MILKKNSIWLSRAPGRHCGSPRGILRMPTAVLMMTGQIEVMKITKIADGLRIEERGQRQWQPGKRRHRAQDLEHRIQAAHRPDRLPDQRAEQHADDCGEAKAVRRRAAATPARARPSPMSCEPLIEERIDDQVVGLAPTPGRAAAGRASGREKATCQTASMIARTTSGGTIVCAACRPIASRSKRFALTARARRLAALLQRAGNDRRRVSVAGMDMLGSPPSAGLDSAGQ